MQNLVFEAAGGWWRSEIQLSQILMKLVLIERYFILLYDSILFFYHFLVFTPLPLLYIRPTKKTDTSPKLDFGVKCAGLLSAYHKVWYLYHTVVLFLIHLELPHFVVPYSGMFWNILECSRKWNRFEHGSLVAWFCSRWFLTHRQTKFASGAGNVLVCSIWLSMLVNDPVLEHEWSCFRTWMILFCGNMMQYHDALAWWNTMVQ